MRNSKNHGASRGTNRAAQGARQYTRTELTMAAVYVLAIAITIADLFIWRA